MNLIFVFPPIYLDLSDSFCVFNANTIQIDGDVSAAQFWFRIHERLNLFFNFDEDSNYLKTVKESSNSILICLWVNMKSS